MNKIFQRTMSLLLALITVVTLLPMVPMEAEAASKYDVAKAVAFGKDEAAHKSVNGLCARYVSACLKAGGIGSVESGECDVLYNNLTTGGWCEALRVNDTNLKKMKAGDVVMVVCENNHPIHAIFITEVGSNYFRYSANHAYHHNEKKDLSYLKSYATYFSHTKNCNSKSANNYCEILHMDSCSHSFGSRGKCTKSGCDKVFDYQATRKPMSGTLVGSSSTKIWPMDVPYSAGSGGVNLLDAKGNKISYTGSVEITAQVTNAYGNTWYEIKLTDGRIGYAYGDTQAHNPTPSKILWISKEIPPKKAIFTDEESPGKNMQGTTINSASGYPLKSVKAAIKRVETNGTETVLTDFERTNLSGNSYSFPSSVDKSGNDLLSFSSLKGKVGLYVYEIVVTATPPANASAEVKAACTLKVRYPFSVMRGKGQVILHLNDGTNTIEKLSASGGGAVTLPTNTRSGYTFLGWAGSPGAPTGEKAGGSKLTVTSEQHLYAVWSVSANAPAQKVTYTVTYNANGGTGAPGAQNKEKGKSLTLSSTVPTRSGYDFLGWATSSTATKAEYAKGASYTTDKAVTLYAVWKQKTTTTQSSSSLSPTSFSTAKTYAEVENIVTQYWDAVTDYGKKTVYWNAHLRSNGPTALKTKAFVDTVTTTPCPNTTSKSEHGHANGCTATTPASCTRKCKSNLFAGVGGTDSNGKFSNTSNDAQCSGFAAYMAYVVFKATSTSDFTLYYGSGANGLNKTSDNTIHPGDIMRYGGHSYFIYAVEGTNAKTIECNTANRDCKLWQGTRKISDILADLQKCNGTTGGLFRNKNLTSAHTIIYNANGGTGAPGTQTKTKGKALTLSSTVPTRSGYDFLGWATSSTATKAEYAKGASYTKDESMTLYAVWQKNYTVTYNANGGSGAPSAQTKTKGKTMTLSSTVPTRSGYAFLGWAASNTATKAEYAKGADYTKDADVTLYAVWKKEGSYSVTYMPNASNVTHMPDNGTKTKDKKYTISTTIPKRTGYVFIEWSVAADPKWNTSNYDPGDEYIMNQDLNLYAQWEQGYAVYYDKNGGTGSMEVSSFKCGKSVNLAKNAFTREGYVFTGWNTKSDGTGTAYGNEASVKDLAAKGDSIKLYAQWTNTYRVVYHPNASDWLGDDISGNMTPSRFEVGKSYSLPANPYKRTHTNILGKKTTYVFLGWTTNSDGTGTLYENKATVTNLSSKPGVDVNLYAKWAKPDEVFTVKYDKNGGTGTMENTIILLDTDTALRKNAFTRSNYKFEKWTTNSDGTGSSYTDGQSVKNLTKGGSSITLYAKWKSTAKTYTVQYQPNGGTGTTKSSSHTVGVAAKLTTNGFTREGCIFDSWNTKADGSGTKYTNAQSVTDLTTTNKATVSLYAQWREVTEAEYLKSCTKYASCMNLTVSNGSGNLMARPVNSGTVTRQLISGETMVSTALYKNSKGEYWYQVRANRDGKTGYIYAGNASSKGIANRNVSFGVTLESYSILKGYKCDILGSVSAQNDILYKVTGVLDDSDPKTAAQTNSISSGFANVKATTLNTKLAFASLSRGKGTLTLTAMLRSAWSDGKNLRWEEFTTEEYPIEFTVRGIYQVVYDSNTTDPVKQMPSNQNKQDAQDLTLSANIPVRTGYTFLGWAKEEDADKVDYLPGDVLKEDSATGNLTLFALWDGPNKYTITFDPNGGTGGPGKATATYGTDFYYPAKYPSLSGCTFLGWSRNKDVDGNADDASKYLLKAPQLFEKDTALYAVWKRSPVNIYFYHNDGSGKISTQTILANMDHTLPDARQFSRTGYTMIGYSDVSGATTPKYLPGEAFTTGTDKILYLVWKVSSWKVSFHANGGIGAPEDQEKVYGTDLLLTTAVPTRTGYTFLGWAETPDAEQPTYYPGDIYGKNADLTLFAVWEKNSGDTEIHYTVTYADFGGSNGPGSAVKIHGVDLLLSDIYPVRENYRFLGWSREANVTVAEFPAGETCYYTEDADIILYAIWERLPVLVYDVNSGKYWQSNAETATEVEAFDCSDLAHITVKLNPSEMLRSWYAPTEDAPERSIQDWYDQFVFAVDLSVGLQIKNDQFDFYISKREGYECRNSITGIEQISFLEDENLVFNIFVLTHDLQGGWLKGNPGSKGPFYDLFWNNYPYWGEGYDQWEKDGYTLIGWSREPNAVTAELPVSFDWNFDEDTVVYAVWQKNENEPVTYSVTYDDNGGSNGPGSDVKKHGEDLQVSVVCPEREHYRFLGWARSADASVPEFQVGEYCWYTEDADIILYAVWEPITYTVFYNTLFGTGYPESQIKYDGQPLILSSVIPTRQGYDFLGWGVNDDGHGVDYRPGDVFELDETVDMYAIWELAPTRVYDVNAGKYWEIEESIATEAEPFDYSNLVHIIITLNPSETIRSWYAPTEEDPERSVQEWYDSYEFAVEMSDAYLQNKGNQFDFYISKGTYSCRNNVNSALNFDFLENEDLTFDIYVLTIDPQGGYYHDNVNDTAVSTALFCGNYPYDRGFAHSWTKEGYTFLGWSRDPNATVAEYPEVFPWDFDEDTTIYAVWQ